MSSTILSIFLGASVLDVIESSTILESLLWLCDNMWQTHLNNCNCYCFLIANISTMSIGQSSIIYYDMVDGSAYITATSLFSLSSLDASVFYLNWSVGEGIQCLMFCIFFRFYLHESVTLAWRNLLVFLL